MNHIKPKPAALHAYDFIYTCFFYFTPNFWVSAVRSENEFPLFDLSPGGNSQNCWLIKTRKLTVKTTYFAPVVFIFQSNQSDFGAWEKLCYFSALAHRLPPSQACNPIIRRKKRQRDNECKLKFTSINFAWHLFVPKVQLLKSFSLFFACVCVRINRKWIFLEEILEKNVTSSFSSLFLRRRLKFSVENLNGHTETVHFCCYPCIIHITRANTRYNTVICTYYATYIA